MLQLGIEGVHPSKLLILTSWKPSLILQSFLNLDTINGPQLDFLGLFLLKNSLEKTKVRKKGEHV